MLAPIFRRCTFIYIHLCKSIYSCATSQQSLPTCARHIHQCTWLTVIVLLKSYYHPCVYNKPRHRQPPYIRKSECERKIESAREIVTKPGQTLLSLEEYHNIPLMIYRKSVCVHNNRITVHASVRISHWIYLLARVCAVSSSSSSSSRKKESVKENARAAANGERGTTFHQHQQQQQQPASVTPVYISCYILRECVYARKATVRCNARATQRFLAPVTDLFVFFP